uniref:U1-type domain-containing protein n=1 Tax=Oryza nivara TaxID=4536 RepID=A0A0E0FNL3_ORYNI
MARFQCEDCGGDDLKKPKLAGHFRSCAQPTGQETVQGHAQCISGAEKYGPPKGQNKASMEIFPSCAGNHLASAATSRQAEGEDRISPLPDDILLLILQELAARVEAIRTCSLSRRWRWLPWLLLEPRISVKKFIPSGVELWMVDKRALDRVAGRFCRAVSRFLAISDATRWLKLMLEFFKNCMNPLFETLSFGIAVDSPRVFGALTKLELRHLQLRSADVAVLLSACTRAAVHLAVFDCDGRRPRRGAGDRRRTGVVGAQVLVVLRSIPKLTRLSVDSWFPDGAPVSLGSVPILADLSLIHGADIQLEDPRPLQGSFSKLTVLNLGDGQYELLWMIFFLQAAPFLQNFNLSRRPLVGGEEAAAAAAASTMVWFQCEDCGDDLKKPKLAGHFRSCSAYRLSCIDCGEFFTQETVQGHTQCISEAEKYGPKGQNKASNNAQGKQDKPKPNADVDINVGLSTYPPWFCSLCKTTTTSKQTLLSHADGKKHRAKAKAYHASQKQANGVEQTPKETVGAPVTESAQVNNERSTENERGVDNDAAKRKRANDTTSEEPDNTKRPNNLSVNSGEVVQSSNEEAETKAKSKGTKDELVSSANLKGSKKQKIKWKKIITKVLQTNPDGVLKLKKLQKLVTKELLECGLTEDKEQMHAILMDKISSSSRFSVDGKRIRLVAKD